MSLVVRPSDVDVTEGGVREICVEFTEGQIPAERVVMLSVYESSSMSLFTNKQLLSYHSTRSMHAYFQIEICVWVIIGNH